IRCTGAAKSAVMVRVTLSRSCWTSVTGMVQSSWSVSDAMSSSMRAMRPRQSCSSSVSMDATDRTASTSPLANCSRPLRRLVSRPAFSSTATCFCTAAKLMSYFAASAETECSPASTRRMMSRRVRSASAWNRASARSSSCSVTKRTYNHLVVCCQGRLGGQGLLSRGVAVCLRQLRDLASYFAAVRDADERNCAGEEELVEFGGAALFGFAVSGEHLGAQGGTLGHEPSGRHVVAVMATDCRHIGHRHPQQFVAAGQASDDRVEA